MEIKCYHCSKPLDPTTIPAEILASAADTEYPALCDDCAQDQADQEDPDRD